MSFAQTISFADMWDGGAGWVWMPLMMIMMVLFWGAVIFGIVWLIRGAAWGRPESAAKPVDTQSALEILERRFADGAISVEDYRTRREVLGNGTGEPKGAGDVEASTTPRA